MTCERIWKMPSESVAMIPMPRHHGPIRDLLIHHQLLRRLIPRDVHARYLGSAFGLIWSIAVPLMILLNYWFFLGVILKAKWGVQDVSAHRYPLMLFSGIVVYQFFADVIGRAPNLILSHGAYVRKVVFPVEVLPWMTIATAAFHLSINCMILFVGQLIAEKQVSGTWLLLPIALLPMMAMTVGLSWIIASLGVYLRDIAQVVPLILTMLMFLSPIFYPMEMVPAPYRDWLMLNPLTGIIEQVREVTLYGRGIDPIAYGAQLLIGYAVMLFGYWWFVRTKKGFADVL